MPIVKLKEINGYIMKKPKGLTAVKVYYDKYQGNVVVKIGSSYVKLKKVI